MPYVTLEELRALPNLGDVVKFTDAELTAARTWFETTFERYTGVAWVPRQRTLRLDGTGTAALRLPNLYPTVTAIRTYAGGVATAYTPAELADVDAAPSGVLTRLSLGYFPRGTRNIEVEYSHGLATPPADVVEAAKVAIRDKVLTDNVGNRQFALVTQEGVVRTSTPGPDRPFGIPFVDEVANARRVDTGVGSAVIA